MWAFPPSLLPHLSVNLKYYGKSVLLLNSLVYKEGPDHIPYINHEGGKRMEMKALHN